MNTEMHENTYRAAQELPPPPAPPPSPPVRARKSPALATLLSLMPGLGQVYVGYYQQGFVNVGVVAVSISVLASGVDALAPLLGVFLAFFWLYNMIDANRRAHHFNRMADGVGGESIPEDFPVPGARGSVPAGVFLVVVGVLFLLDLNTDMSMDWIENWWPLLLVGGGAWLIYKARRREG